MKKLATATCAIALISILACPLAGCSSPQDSNGGGGGESSQETQLDPAVKSEIQSLIAQAREHTFDNVTFDVTVETAVTARDDEGNMQQQVSLIERSGELDQNTDDPKMHMVYEQSSNMELGKTVYEMYIDKSGMIMMQEENLYRNASDKDTVNAQIASVTSIASETEVNDLLDVARSYEIQEQANGDKLITIVADVDKLIANSLIDTSSLPEGSSVATLVASYVISSDNHFKTVRLMSSTSGSPTYRVDQNFKFSKYDETVMPEWPDIQKYYAKMAGFTEGADGRMYIEDDGQMVYFDYIDDEGMIHVMPVE